MSDDAAADQNVWFRHGVHHAVVHHTVVHHAIVHHHAVVHHAVIHHAVVHLFNDEEHGDRLSDDAFFAAKILKKLLLMEGTVAHIISGKAINSAACWVLELDNVSFCILLLERVEFGADSLALIGASATPGVENEANSTLLDFFSHRWLINKIVEGSLSLHGVFWELTEFDLTHWQVTVKELTDSEGWLVELGGNVGDRGRLKLHVGREMAIGHNWLIWHDRLWLRSRCGVRHVMILLLCIWVVMLLHLSVWIHLLLLLVMHNLAWVGRLMLLLLLLSWLAVVGMGLLLLLLSMWVSLLLLLGWLMVGLLLLLLLSMWVRLLLSILVRLLLSMWVSLLLLLGWLMVGLLLLLLLLLSWLMVALLLLLLLLLSWLMVALLLLLLLLSLLSVWVLLLLLRLLSVWVLVHLLLRGMLVV